MSGQTILNPQGASLSFVAAPVLAGAYRGKDIGERRLLWHALEVVDGLPIRVMCGRVHVDHIASGQDDAHPVSCAKCQAALRRAVRS